MAINGLSLKERLAQTLITIEIVRDSFEKIHSARIKYSQTCCVMTMPIRLSILSKSSPLFSHDDIFLLTPLPGLIQKVTYFLASQTEHHGSCPDLFGFLFFFRYSKFFTEDIMTPMTIILTRVL
jgi:hypothetical protein